MTIEKTLLGNIKGPKGDTGDTGNGIASITEGTSVADQNDSTVIITTYNVNYTNGNVGSFTVRNGAKGDQGIQGVKGDKGDGFAIEKTYASVSAMNADASNVSEGKFVMIASNVEDTDNAKLYVKGASSFSYIADLSGATGINGVGVSSITQSDGVTSGTAGDGGIRTSTITYTNGDTGTFVVKDGLKGDTGATGKGISSISKTGTSGLVDTYTITYTDNDTDTITVTNGAQGTQGIQGIQGEQGLIPYLSVDSNGEASGTGNLYVEYLTASEYAQRTSQSGSGSSGS